MKTVLVTIVLAMTRGWVKRREEKGNFNKLVQELRQEDHFGFKEMFRMDPTDFENMLTRISVHSLVTTFVLVYLKGINFRED